MITDKEVQSIIDRGVRRTPPAEPLPVLFGTRVIENPRIIYAASQDLPRLSADYPAGGANSPFVLQAALCYGKIDSVDTLYVNGQRLASHAVSYLYTHELFSNASFKDTNFFGEGGELSGQCVVSPGSPDESAFLSPAGTELYPYRTQYRGIAVAQVWADVNASQSFNNWGFLTRRFDTNWEEGIEKIPVERHVRQVAVGGDTKDRPIILCVDCSPINGIAVNREGPELKYRYDYIREQTIKTIEGYANVLAQSRVSYRWFLEVVLLKPYASYPYRGGDGAVNTARSRSQEVVPVQFSFVHNGESRSGRSAYWMRSDDRAGNIAYLNALADAVRNHPYLQIARAGNTSTRHVPIGANPTYSGYFDVADRSRVLEGSFRKFFEKGLREAFASPINENYTGPNNVLSAILFNNNIGPRGGSWTTPDMRKGILSAPCDWSGVFDYVRQHRAESMAISSTSLPQISFITGPTWPYFQGSWNFVRVRRFIATRVIEDIDSTPPTWLQGIRNLGGIIQRTFTSGGAQEESDFDPNAPHEEYLRKNMWLPMLRDLYDLTTLRFRSGDVYQGIRAFELRLTNPYTRGRYYEQVAPFFNYYPRPSCYNEYTNMLLALGPGSRVPNDEQFRTDMCIFDPFFYSDLKRTMIPCLLSGQGYRIGGVFYYSLDADWTVGGVDITDSSRLLARRDAIPPSYLSAGGGSQPMFTNRTTLLGGRAEDSFDENSYMGHRDDHYLPDRRETLPDLSFSAQRGVTSSLTHDQCHRMILKGMGAYRSPVSLGPAIFESHGINPVHILVQCFNNLDWGKGKFDVELHNDSFKAAAEQVYRERLACCFLWRRQSNLNSFIDEVLRHIDAVIYEENLMVYIKLIGRPFEEQIIDPLDPSRVIPSISRNPTAMTEVEYTAAQTRWRFNETNVHEVTNFKLPREDELVNSIQVQYTRYDALAPDAENIVNEGLVSRYGTNMNTLDYQGAANSYVAGKMAKRDLMLLSSPLISCQAEVYRSAAKGLHVGDIIQLKWLPYNIKESYFRTLSITRGDGRNNKVRLSLLQVNTGDLEVVT